MKTKFNFPLIISALALLSIFGLSACNQDPNKKEELDGATFGEITIAIDATYKPIFDSMVEAFEATYKRAKINVIYTSELEAVNLVLQDSARVAVVAREFTDNEKKVIEKSKIMPRTEKVAIDAIAIIVNNNNKLMQLSEEEIKGILTGKFTKWSDIRPEGSNLPINVVFESNASGIAEYFKTLYSIDLSQAKNFSGAKDNFEPINAVKNSPSTIAFLSSGWVKNTKDSTNTSFIGEVTVVSVAKEGSAEFVPPLQAYIHTKTYPYTRGVYMLRKEARMGLGTGFTKYVATEKGQRIFLKAGLLPSTMPIRVVELHSKPINLTQ